jgi:hypothetical protein
MIVTLNKILDNPFYAICKKFQKVYDKLVSKPEIKNVGRPKKYSDLQIIQCLLYKAMNRIYCLRELEWKLSTDILTTKLLGLSNIPDHSTFCIRAKEIEKSLFYQIYRLHLLIFAVYLLIWFGILLWA